MSDLTAISSWDGVYQLETTDPVLGGDGEKANEPHQDLLNRIEYLKDLQKRSVRFVKESFTTPTTSANPAKKLLTISDFNTDIINLKILVYLEQTGGAKALVEAKLSLDTTDTSGYIFAVHMKSDNFSYSNEFSDDIYLMAKNNIDETIDIWLECEDSGTVECVVSSILDETTDLGGWSIENGFSNITFASDVVTTTMITSAPSSGGISTLKFISSGANGSPYTDVQQTVIMSKTSDEAPNVGFNNIRNETAKTVPDYLPVGSVIMWYGDVADIPAKWQQCDGTNGTPNLSGKFIRGATVEGDIGNTDGSDSQSASLNISTGGSHGHSGQTDPSPSNFWQRTTEGNAVISSVPIYSHYHDFNTGIGGSHNHTGSTGAFDNRPSFMELMFIMKVSY